MDNLYWIRSENFGDKLNPILYKLLAGKYPVWTDHTSPEGKYYFIGSTAQDAGALDVLFGAGLISADAGSRTWCFPRVLATRGPLTELVFERNGADVPRVYGDPAALMGLFYSPRDTMDNGYIGVIPHYVDSERVREMELPTTAKVINITQKDPFRVIDEIAAARYVVSSCLHGLIIAEAYGIPAIWAEFSDSVSGAGFKFRDYYYGMEREPRHPIDMRAGWKYEDPENWRPRSDGLKTKIRMIEACPFISPDIRRWFSAGEYREAYDERTKLISNLVRPAERVLCLGSGKHTIRNYLPPYTKLITSDLTRMFGADIVANLNDDVLPAFPAVDVVVMSGVLEYIEDVPRLIRHISLISNSIALSYAHRERDAAQANGWKNSLSEVELKDIMRRYGYNSALDGGSWNGQKIYRFEKLE